MNFITFQILLEKKLDCVGKLVLLLENQNCWKVCYCGIVENNIVSMQIIIFNFDGFVGCLWGIGARKFVTFLGFTVEVFPLDYRGGIPLALG